MRKFFRARILHEQEYQKWRSGFRNSFFAPDCRYDSHAGIIERFQSEIIKSIESQNGQYKVITEQTFNYSEGRKTIPLRYSLKPGEGGWKIQQVETECFACKGGGDLSCPICKGNHWK
jgi:hypothetical protein